MSGFFGRRAVTKIACELAILVVTSAGLAAVAQRLSAANALLTQRDRARHRNV
jgi:hypothetical protein